MLDNTTNGRSADFDRGYLHAADADRECPRSSPARQITVVNILFDGPCRMACRVFLGGHGSGAVRRDALSDAQAKPLSLSETASRIPVTLLTGFSRQRQDHRAGTTC